MVPAFDGTNNSVVLFIDPSGLSPTMTGSLGPTSPPLFNLLIFFKKPVRSICLGILVPKGSYIPFVDGAA